MRMYYLCRQCECITCVAIANFLPVYSAEANVLTCVLPVQLCKPVKKLLLIVMYVCMYIRVVSVKIVNEFK